MNYNCKLVKKTFTDDKGEVREYYVLQFDLADDEKLEITIKGEKAKLLLLSSKLNNKMPDIPFFSQDEVSSLK